MKAFLLPGLLFTFYFLLFTSAAHAAPILDDAGSVYNHWAWNDVIGWIDFKPTGCTDCPNIDVSNEKLTGYASSPVGYLALDCATSPAPSTCSGEAGNWFVSNSVDADTETGNLAGWAWNDAIGWVSFCGNASGGSIYDSQTETWNCPTVGDTPYQVKVKKISDTESVFTGFAWNDVIGWISFTCDHSSDGTVPLFNSCATVNYRVKTSWVPVTNLPLSAELTSSVFDTCAVAQNCGAQVNSIVWHGDVKGGAVSFRIASSDDPDDQNWTFYGKIDTSDYTELPGKPIWISNALPHMNKRYFRYKVILKCGSADPLQLCESDDGPQVDDIIVNWSP